MPEHTKPAAEIKPDDFYFDGHCWDRCVSVRPNAGIHTPVRLENSYRATYWKTDARIGVMLPFSVNVYLPGETLRVQCTTQAEAFATQADFRGEYPNAEITITHRGAARP